jgi:four helix bundle protein
MDPSMAHKVEELPVFSYADGFCDAVTAILKGSKLRKNGKLYEQIADANESIVANIDEGFDQQSDDGFAKFLQYSKGSLAEVMRRLRRAARREQVSREGESIRDAGSRIRDRGLGIKDSGSRIND